MIYARITIGQRTITTESFQRISYSHSLVSGNSFTIGNACCPQLECRIFMDADDIIPFKNRTFIFQLSKDGTTWFNYGRYKAEECSYSNGVMEFTAYGRTRYVFSHALQGENWYTNDVVSVNDNTAYLYRYGTGYEEEGVTHNLTWGELIGRISAQSGSIINLETSQDFNISDYFNETEAHIYDCSVVCETDDNYTAIDFSTPNDKNSLSYLLQSATAKVGLNVVEKWDGDFVIERSQVIPSGTLTITNADFYENGLHLLADEAVTVTGVSLTNVSQKARRDTMAMMDRYNATFSVGNYNGIHLDCSVEYDGACFDPADAATALAGVTRSGSRGIGTWTPLEVDFIGDSFIDVLSVNKVVTVTDGDATYEVPILQYSWEWDGGIKAHIACPNESDNRNDVNGDNTRMTTQSMYYAIGQSNGVLGNLSLNYAEFKTAYAETLLAQTARINNLDADKANIDMANINDGSITNAKIADATIENAKIKNGTITNAKIADATIEGAKIKGGTITGALIADSTITNAKIDSLSASKITTGTLDCNDLTVINLSAESITVGLINGQQIADLAIGNTHLVDGAVTTDKLDLNAIKSLNYTPPTQGYFSQAGTFFNLADGVIRSKNFAIESDGTARFKGQIEASSGVIGGFITDATTIHSSDYQDNDVSPVLPNGDPNPDYVVLSGIKIDSATKSFETPQIKIKDDTIKCVGDMTAGTRKPDSLAGKFSFANGYDCEASGDGSSARGELTTASGYCSSASGYSTTASGIYSSASGDHTTASGYCSNASGDHTTAEGDYSNASGVYTNAFGDYSSASGYCSITFGDYSNASGCHTEAQGDYSNASGIYTIAELEAQSVCGKYNADCEDSLFIVGNGTSEVSRSNALEVLNNGSTNINGSTPATQSEYTERIGASNNYNVKIGANRIQGCMGNNTEELHLNYNGGTVKVGANTISDLEVSGTIYRNGNRPIITGSVVKTVTQADVNHRYINLGKITDLGYTGTPAECCAHVNNGNWSVGNYRIIGAFLAPKTGGMCLYAWFDTAGLTPGTCRFNYVLM